MPRPHERSTWRAAALAAAREHARLRPWILALLGLSLLDLLITHALLRRSPSFYESNPVASWVFQRWNVAGMTLFKFAVIGAVIAVAELVERLRPGRGRLVLAVGILATSAAIAQGLRLLTGLLHSE